MPSGRVHPCFQRDAARHSVPVHGRPARPVFLRVTQIYRRENGKWKSRSDGVTVFLQNRYGKRW